MAKNVTANPDQEMSTTAQNRLIDQLDFSNTQRQVDSLMKTVLHETNLNENKIRFIKEQLSDQRYQINAKMIASKLLEYADDTKHSSTPELVTEE